MYVFKNVHQKVGCECLAGICCNYFYAPFHKTVPAALVAVVLFTAPFNRLPPFNYFLCSNVSKCHAFAY